MLSISGKAFVYVCVLNAIVFFACAFCFLLLSLPRGIEKMDEDERYDVHRQHFFSAA
jgi:hypothetical protein